RLDDALGGRRDALSACVREVEQLARELGRYAAGAEGDPERRQVVEERLDALRKLCRKHGQDAEGLRALREELRGELDRIERRHEEAARLGRERQRLQARAVEAAGGLGALRRKAAVRLETRVQAGLSQLALGGARFTVQLAEAPLSAVGTDAVEFLFTANAGEPLRPLARVASGGEASRLMLALKRAGAGEAGPSACVLDEADTGVSGAVAEVVGRMIHELSEHRQVLCITHLPQVAAYADHHLRILKEEQGGRAVSHVVSLSDREARTRELARMLAGVELTREALGAAEALVRSAARRPSGRAVRPGPRRRKAG
ncbi:MAG: DNA repair protein RecN, partial [Deltaproteobacteria bacterium]|nr:DNA repair protein RecN [Deltaproteobacteria bacterium]